MGAKLFAEFFKSKRLEHKISLRQFCLENKLDPGNVSKMERGIMKPPGEKDLRKYAKALHIDEESDEWRKFNEYATLSRGEIPKEILSNEVVMRQLPVLFRTLEGKKLTEKKLKDLYNTIQKEMKNE